MRLRGRGRSGDGDEVLVEGRELLLLLEVLLVVMLLLGVLMLLVVVVVRVEVLNETNEKDKRSVSELRFEQSMLFRSSRTTRLT